MFSIVKKDISLVWQFGQNWNWQEYRIPVDQNVETNKHLNKKIDFKSLYTNIQFTSPWPHDRTGTYRKVQLQSSFR